MFENKTTLIIPTKDRSYKVISLLKKLHKNKITFKEIIVIDSSGSKHKSRIKCYLKDKKVKLFNTKPSTTFQRNIGIKNTKNSKYILFFDDDIKIGNKTFHFMNKAIKKYQNNKNICSYGFNLKSNKSNFKNEKLKNNFLFKLTGIYTDKPGKVLKSGWHSKISNLKKDTIVEWIYSGATIFIYNKIKNKKFENLNKGFNYLEDLYFSYSLTKKKMKHIVIAGASVYNPNFIERNDFGFGYIEIVNRHKFVSKFKLNKFLFYLSAILKSNYLILSLLNFKVRWIKRFIGNYIAILQCCFKDLKSIF